MSSEPQADAIQDPAKATLEARDGEDPPHDDDNSKVGYPVVSRGEDPPHDDDNSKVAYPVVSRGEDPPHDDGGVKVGNPAASE